MFARPFRHVRGMVADNPFSALVLIVVGALLAAFGWRFAFHSDEMTVLLHAQRFAEGQFGSPGRPGLLWLFLAPLLWLPDPVDVLRGGRIVSTLATFGTVGLVAGLAAAGPPRPGRMPPGLAVLLLLCGGTWMTHAVELRTDTFTTPLTLATIGLLWANPRRAWTFPLAVAAASAAVLISQKSVYNIAGLAVAWVLAAPTADPERSSRAGLWRDLRRAVGWGALLIGGWYGLMAIVSGLGSDFVARNMNNAARTAFGSGVTQAEKVHWMAEAITRGPFLWGAAILGVVPALARRRVDGRPLASLLTALVMTAVLPLHRGFFPYYIASIEPLLALPAALLLWVLFEKAAALLRAVRVPAAGAVAAVLVALPLGKGLWAVKGPMEAAWQVENRWQLEIAREAWALFPGSVPYVGGIHMVPKAREVAGYLTSEVRTAKRSVDKHFFNTLIRKERPRYFIHEYMTRDLYLRPAERRLLHTNYVPYRHNLYVHTGRAAWKDGSEGGRREIDLLFAGPYTVRFRPGANAAPPETQVDGRGVREGDVLELEEGAHVIEVGSAEKAGEIWLVAGRDANPDPSATHVDLSTFPKDRGTSRSRFQHYDQSSGSWDLLTPPESPRYDRQKRRHQRRLRELDEVARADLLIDPVSR